MIQRGCGLLAMKCIIPTVKLVTLTFVCVQGPGCDGCRVGMVLKQRVLSQRRDEKFRMPGIDFFEVHHVRCPCFSCIALCFDSAATAKSIPYPASEIV